MSQNYDTRSGNLNSPAKESVALLNIQQPPAEDDQYPLNENGTGNGAIPRDTANTNNIIVPLSMRKLLPPRGKPAEYITRFLACLVVWAAMFCIVGKSALPGGNLFSIYILLIAASLGGFFIGRKIGRFYFPPLLGMLIVGFLLKNVKYINIAKDIDPTWSSVLRSTALVVILLVLGLVLV